MISQLEIGNVDAVLRLEPEQLDETGNTEMLNWASCWEQLDRFRGNFFNIRRPGITAIA